MIKFYTDEGFPRPTTLAFRNLGYDVLTCQEAVSVHEGAFDNTLLRIYKPT